MADDFSDVPYVMLAPQARMLWAAFPSILYTHGRVLIDASDYATSQDNSGRSRYDTIVARNLKIIREEGYLLVTEYKRFLPSTARSQIAQLGKELEYQLDRGIASKWLLSAYGNYRGTSVVKTSLISDNTELLTGHRAVLRELDCQIAELSDDAAKAINSYVNRNCLLQYLWKTLATLALRNNLELDLNTPSLSFYDNPEYGDLASAIRGTLAEMQSSCGNPIAFPEKAETYRRILRRLLNLAAPKTPVMTENDMLVFLKNRNDFSELRRLVRRMDDLLGVMGEAEASSALQRDLNRIISLIQEEMRKVRKARTAMWLPVAVASSGWKEVKEVFSPDDKVFREARDRLSKALGPSDQWVFCFLRLFDRASILQVEKELAETTRRLHSKTSAEQSWWITGKTDVPWYAYKDQPPGTEQGAEGNAVNRTP